LLEVVADLDESMEGLHFSYVNKNCWLSKEEVEVIVLTL